MLSIIKWKQIYNWWNLQYQIQREKFQLEPRFKSWSSRSLVWIPVQVQIYIMLFLFCPQALKFHIIDFSVLLHQLLSNVYWLNSIYFKLFNSSTWVLSYWDLVFVFHKREVITHPLHQMNFMELSWQYLFNCMILTQAWLGNLCK